MQGERIRRSPVLGYGLAILGWLAAFALRAGLAHWFPPGFPYLTFFPAVVVVAYFAGLRPALLTAVLSGLSAWWFWIGQPGFDWSAATGVALVFYAFVVGVDIFFIDGMTRAREALEIEVRRSAALAQSRDLLLREVQHRVSNNIQVVSALLRLEAASVEGDARRVLNEASARTAVIARVQHGLSDAEGRATVFKDFAQAIIDDTLTAAGRGDVKAEVEGVGHSLTAEEATPVMLIMLECVNNALEHGLPGRAGRISVSLTEDGDLRRLEVRDDGVGVATDFDIHKTKSLGLRIVRGMAEQLSGDFRIAAGRPGTTCGLTYPKPVAWGPA